MCGCWWQYTIRYAHSSEQIQKTADLLRDHEGKRFEELKSDDQCINLLHYLKVEMLSVVKCKTLTFLLL